MSPDGKVLASGSENGLVVLTDAATGKELRRLAKLPGAVASLGFTADGKTLLMAGRDGTLRFHDPATGKLSAERKGFHKLLSAAVVSPDGRFVASLGSDHDENVYYADRVRLWHGDYARVLAGIQGQDRLALLFDGGPYFWAVAFSADGKYLATSESKSSRRGWYDHAIQIWEVATARQVRRIKTDERPVALAFAADGKSLAAALNERRWRHFGRTPSAGFWDLATGREIGRLKGHRGNIEALAFSPDGGSLATASADGTVLVWAAAPFLPTRQGPERAPDREELEALWNALEKEDAGKAHAAIDKLAAAPEEMVPFFQKRMRPAPAADAQHIARLIADLDSNRFAVREKARLGLENLGEAAEPALRKALASKPALSVHRQLEALLALLEKGPPPPDQLRTLRAITALERAATPQARRLLKELAGGAAEARLTRESRAALVRRAAHRAGSR